MNTFAINFMKKLHKQYPVYVKNDDDIYFLFTHIADSYERQKVIEEKNPASMRIQTHDPLIIRRALYLCAATTIHAFLLK